jgi:hypothetical protein
MTSGLRKAHKYIWLILIVIIPVLIFFSIKDLDVFASESDSNLSMETIQSNVLKVSENELIKASLIEKDSTSFIEVILKSPLKNPSSIVYALKSKDQKGRIIGQINTVGIYNFDVTKNPKGIIIYDALKESLITKLNF